MSRPSSRPAATAAALSSAMAGAVDLAALKARSEAAARQQAAPAPRPAAVAGRPVRHRRDRGELPGRCARAVVDRSRGRRPVGHLVRTVQAALAGAGTPGRGRQRGWLLAKVDIDANPRIAQAFGVQSIRWWSRWSAASRWTLQRGQPEPQVREWINALLDALRDRSGHPGGGGRAGAGPEPVEEPDDPRFVAAEDALERGDYPARRRPTSRSSTSSRRMSSQGRVGAGAVPGPGGERGPGCGGPRQRRARRRDAQRPRPTPSWPRTTWRRRSPGWSNGRSDRG